jgi:hypothetical protein
VQPLARLTAVGAVLGATVLSACGSSASGPAHSKAMPHAAAMPGAVAPAAGSMHSAAQTGMMGQAIAAALVIRHQTRGCHTWSYDGGPFRATQTLQLHSGATLRITDNDVMPHRLVQVAGPSVALIHPSMTHAQSTAAIRFPAAGTYRFRTVAGEDYMPGITTLGADNILRLNVTVS